MTENSGIPPTFGGITVQGGGIIAKIARNIGVPSNFPRNQIKIQMHRLEKITNISPQLVNINKELFPEE